jgi:hypothetical protein
VSSTEWELVIGVVLQRDVVGYPVPQRSSSMMAERNRIGSDAQFAGASSQANGSDPVHGRRNSRARSPGQAPIYQ